jgi:butyryl-CoA dehydrogenase
MGLFSDDQGKILRMMFPQKIDEYSEILEAFEDFVVKEILPTAPAIDKNSSFPKENMDKIFRQGFTNIPYPEKLGGLGLPYPIYVACMEMVASACASTAISLAIHGTVCDGLYQFGTPAQHEKYLRPLILGEKLAAFALTESDAGSDARAMKTNATLRDGEWHVNGAKMYITNSGKADFYFVFAKTAKGHAAIIVPKEARGFSQGANIPKMGLRGSSLMGLNFDDVTVPEENLVGEDGQGFEYAKTMLQSGRITIAALGVGIAQIARNKAISYSKERTAFGRQISDFQMTRSKIADMDTDIAAARLMTYYAGFLKHSKREYSVEACEAKLFVTEMALRICNEAIQLHGGYGYTDEADVHRHWRDAKLMTIGEGTSEIMKVIIANAAFGPEEK